jgi:hypothetical protein
MTAPLLAERAKELREQIRTGAVVIWSPDISGVADIINIVERYSAMRAENASDKRGPAKCPVCEGTGWNPTEPPPGATNPTSVPCHSCKGAGWILPYGPFCFGETTPAPSPAPTIKPNVTVGPSVEDELEEDDLIPLTPGELKGLRNPAPLPAEVPPEAVLPEAVEEAITRMHDAIFDAYQGRANHNGVRWSDMEEGKDKAALAVIKSALRPKVVSRETIGKMVHGTWICDDEEQAIDLMVTEFRELGIEVGD